MVVEGLEINVTTVDLLCPRAALTCMNLTPEACISQKPDRSCTCTPSKRRMVQEGSLAAQLQNCCQANKMCLALTSAMCTLAQDYKKSNQSPTRNGGYVLGSFDIKKL